MDDKQALATRNDQFIEAFRQGSWELLEPVLSPGFSYLDGATGEIWTHERYVDSLRSHPSPSLSIDQVAIHVDGDTAIVSARTSRQPGKHGRYVDTYQRRGEEWLCVHACVWPLQQNVVIPHIVVRGAENAAAFYRKAAQSQLKHKEKANPFEGTWKVTVTRTEAGAPPPFSATFPSVPVTRPQR